MAKSCEESTAKKARSTTLYHEITSSGRPLLLDGEVGGLAWKRGKSEHKTALVPASILLDDPEVIKNIHLEYIRAGAQVITTNTYATVRKRCEDLLQSGDEWETMITTACRLAVEAREASGKDVLIAGTLPPLHGSYKPDQVGNMDEILPVYAEHVQKMQEYVDVFLCETMSTAKEAWAALKEAKKSGKPVWVAWTIADDASGLLRSGETLQEAWDAIADLKPDGVLVNCCAPESVSVALPMLAKMGPSMYGGYGNGFTAIPKGWKVEKGGISSLGLRRDLTVENYTHMAQGWLDGGATLIGGCCQVGPEYITDLRSMMNARGQDPA